MVGGVVVETLPFRDERGSDLIYVNCGGTGVESGEECAVDLEDSNVSRSISEGDTLWWQGGYAFWTPKSKAFREMKVRRLSYSGVPHPSLRQAEAS